MAEKTPVRVNYDGSNNPIGFAEFQADDFIGLDDGGTGGSYASLAELLSGIGLGTADTPTFTGLTTSGNVIIGGNLTVDGTTTTVNSTTVTIDDPIFTLGGDTELSADDNKDRGIEFRWHDGTGSKLGFFGFDDSTGKFTFIPDATNAAETFSGTVGTIVANLEGNVTGTVSSLSGLDTDDLAEGSTNLYYTDEKVDDRVAALLIDSATSGIDISYDDAAGQLTISTDLSEVVESLQDNVQGLFSGGTGITTSYDDSANTLSLSVDFTEFDTDDLTEGSTNLFYSTSLANTDIDARVTKSFVDALNVDADTLDGNDSTAFATAAQGTLADSAVQPNDNVSDLTNDAGYITATLTQEEVEDFVGGMVSGNTETLIGVTYDDTNGKLDFVVDNDLSNYDNTTSGFITATLTQEQVEDFVGGMLGGTETLITVSYDDTDGNIDFVVEDDLSQYDNTTSAFITLTSLSGGTGVTYDNSTGAISIGQAVSTSSDVTFNDVTVSGDLTVSGTTTTVNSTTVTIDDPIVRYADNNTGNSVDIGFYGKYVQSSTTKYAGLVWDASQSDKFRLFHGNQSEPTTTVDITGTGYTTGTLIANVEGDLTGDVTGNADTATALASGQNFSLTGDVTATAVSFDGTGAVALSTSVTESAVTQHEAALSITESQISDLGSYITASSTDTLTNKTINFENNTVIVEYAVTASGGNFLIDGEANASISFSPGIVYRFDLSDSSVASHPFKLSTTEDGSHNSGTEYTTGKTSNGTQGSSGAYVEYTVNAATSDILYYYCSSHSGMGGTITVFGSSYGDADVQAYISAGTGISISGSGVISSTITQYADSDVQAYISAGAGISISGSGQISSTITQYSDSDAQAVSINNVVEDTSPQLGGNLDLNSNDITGTGNISTTGTLSLTNTTTSDTLLLTTTEDSSSAAPVLTFKRNSSSPSNGDYLGQLKFKGENDADQEVVYAKITGKISDVTDTTEDGLLEFALRKAGSNNIGARLTSTDLQLLNGTGLTVAGDATITGNLTVSGTTTTINTETLTVDDNIIVLNNNVTGTPTENSGIEIERGTSTNKTLIWNETDDKWTVGSETFVAGTFEGALTGDVTGNVTGDVTGDVTGAIIVTGKNESGSTIAAGVPVYISGQAGSGTEFTVDVADADGTGTMPAIGITTASANNNASTSILAFGKYVGLDTSSFSVGDELYVSTSGTLTTTPPTGESALLQKIAKVIRSHASDGEIFVQGAGRSNAVPNLDDGDIFIGNASNQATTSSFNTLADARIALTNLEDLANVGFSAPGASEDDKVVFWDNTAGAFGLSTVAGLAGQGEVNTASNIGTAGVGIFDGKVGEDLQFKKLNAGSAKITITDDTSNNEVDIDFGTVSIDDLSDVDITTTAPTNGQALVWNASNNEFEPGTVASSTNYFQTFAVSGQSDVSPDSTTDTINFAAGSNVTITTDASTDTITIASTDTNTQLTQEQVEDFVNGVIVAGTNITKTYDDSAGTLTIAATGGAANAFSTLAVAGQSNVVADAETDTLTLSAGTGITITTDASSDTITFAASGGSAGSMPVTLSGGTSDPINLSSIDTIGAIPFTDFQGNTDNIDLTGTSQTVTTFADNDGDTKIEVERTADDDTVYIKAGGTDAVTVTSAGVTINNLTVTGTSTQANEMKITDTLIELNADGTSLGVDAGLVIERGNTGADAAFIWDESSDSFAVGTLSTDGAILFTKADGTSQPLPISSNEVVFNHADGTADNLPITSDELGFTEADGTTDNIASVNYGPDTDMSVKITEATLKAKTQTTGDDSTAVATTAFVQASLGGVESDTIKDADNDTKIEVEASSDADEIVITTGGQERAKVDNNVSMSARGGFFTHNLAMHASETFTIASTEGTVAAGPLDIQGTVDVQGSLVVL